MEDEDSTTGKSTDRRLISDCNFPSGPPGVENDNTYEPTPSPMMNPKQNKDFAGGSNSSTSSRDPRRKQPRNSRSNSPAESGRRRRRSTSSPDRRTRRRFDDRDPRNRRRSRSRDRPRSPPSRTSDRRGGGGGGGGSGVGGGTRDSRNRSTSRDRKQSVDRFRSNRRNSRSNSRSRRNNWSPVGKKGPVSPPPQQIQQQHPQQQLAYNMPPMQMYNDGGYNNYSQPPPQNIQYNQQQQQYSGYDYSMQPVPPPGSLQPPPFNAYAPPPSVMLPIPPGDDFQQGPPTWNMGGPPPGMALPLPQQQQQIQQQQQQQHVHQPMMQITKNEEDEKLKRDAAIALEKKNQRIQLRKQREDYKRRSTALKRELVILKEQRDDLISGSEPPSPTTKGFLKENDRLQLQIENKISTIENVIDMLSGIIGNDKSPSPIPAPPPPSISLSSSPPPLSQQSSSSSKNKPNIATLIPKSDPDSSPEQLKSKVLESMNKNRDGGSKLKDNDNLQMKHENSNNNKVNDKLQPPLSARTPFLKINYVHYDPEMHWCIPCQNFPKTAKDYLTHLHSKEHQDMQKVIEAPWHEKPMNDEMPTYSDAPTKRTPIRGLQFFVPTSGWYCKLCSIWMGDLHCASLHLKSQTHATQYQEYTAQNPHFEIDWVSDRQKAYECKRDITVEPPPPPQLLLTSQTPSSVVDGIPLQLQVGAQKHQQQKSTMMSPEAAAATTSSLVVTPLQASQSSSSHYLDDKKKKKKSKKEDRKEKKKKKRSKKRRHSSSSSSSSSSDSDSDDDSESASNKKNPTGNSGSGDHLTKEDTSHSIRVAMRNLLQQQKEQHKQQLQKLDDNSGGGVGGGGKWTVVQPAQLPTPVPPPPTISANGNELKKKDDLLIAQWNTPEAIISDKEKKLLEQLKGRLKNRTEEKTAALNRGGGGGAGRKSPSRERRRSASRDRDRRRSRSRSRSRGRGNGGGRNYGGRSRDNNYRRRSRSRSRSPSGGRFVTTRRRSSSRSRGRRIEKAIVRYPEFRPRVPEKETDRRPRSDDESNDKGAGGGNSGRGSSNSSNKSDKKTTVAAAKKQPPVPTPSSNANKKLPFIGRMPVFKKQTNDMLEEESKKEELQQAAAAQMDQRSVYYQHQQHQHQQQHLLHHQQHLHHHQMHGQQMYQYDGLQHMSNEDCEDLMPDPMQFVSLMGAPPPPPVIPPPHLERPDKNEPVLPPGIDEADADLVLKPISDAPMPRKGPLPQDFQDALSIIFPGEKKPEDIAAQQMQRSNAIVTDVGINEPTFIPDAVGVQMLTADPTETAMMLLQQQQQQQQQQEMQLSHEDQSQHGMDLYGQAYTTAVYSDVNGSNMIETATAGVSSSTLNIEHIQQQQQQLIPQSFADDVEIPTSVSFEVLSSTSSIPVPVPPPPIPSEFHDAIVSAAEDPTVASTEIILNSELLESTEVDQKKSSRMDDLDDLAMLGIDADDLAAQCM